MGGAAFANLSEPPYYFKKEVRQSSEMNYEELRRYIRDLQQSGFDVVRLRVQLYEKFAFPLITLVMAVLAGPLLLSAGKTRGPGGGGGGGGACGGFLPSSSRGFHIWGGGPADRPPAWQR